MLACGHDRTPFDRAPFGSPICEHLRAGEGRAGEGPRIDYVKWYVGSGLDAELLCSACADEREKGLPTAAESVCEVCFAYYATAVGELVGIRGKPGIRTRSEPFSVALRHTPLPKQAGTVVDLAPVGEDGRSTWILLSEEGVLTRFDADTGDSVRLASVSVDLETGHEPWCGHTLRRRLYASPRAEFAAVVNDYGRFGQIVDLRSGVATLALDGGDYHQDTVPFSFAFIRAHGRVLAIHRTAWNRLDVSDPATGELLTDRGPTSYGEGEQRPPHYLDYFHGALCLNLDGTWIADDGWIWHPVGVPTAWSVTRWLAENVWESEDGPTMKSLCGRTYYWDHAMAWLDGTRVAIGGIGDDDNVIVDGARVFDVTASADDGGAGARELTAFAGPAGLFFGDGKWLYSSDQSGLSRWDVRDGARTGYLPDFRPTRHHASARELVQLLDGALVRWSIRE